MAQSEVFRLCCSLLPAKDDAIQRKFIYVPLVLFASIFQIHEIQHPLAIESLLPAKIDMAHGLNNNPHFAWRVQAFYLNVETF